MAQSNSMADVLRATYSFPTWASGLAIAGLNGDPEHEVPVLDLSLPERVEPAHPLDDLPANGSGTNDAQGHLAQFPAARALPRAVLHALGHAVDVAQ